MKPIFLGLCAAASLTIGSTAYAQDNFENQLKARQGQFQIMAMNLGILGGMARGKIEYDADMAQAAADTLVAVSQIQQGPMWPEGSDDLSIDGTRAQTTIWDQNADFLSKWGDFGVGALAVQAAAGNGLDAIGPALGQIGGTCKACHDTHRAPES